MVDDVNNCMLFELQELLTQINAFCVRQSSVRNLFSLGSEAQCSRIASRVCTWSETCVYIAEQGYSLYSMPLYDSGHRIQYSLIYRKLYFRLLPI
jgi:hypothetical protein